MKQEKKEDKIEQLTTNFDGFTEEQKKESAVAIEITTGIGKKYGIKIAPADGAKPVLIAVHL
ncbi:MAG: hypothetical protein R3B07_11570 [Polyangiaceae bacterium]